MKDYDNNKEWSYIKYWDVNYLYGRAMSQNFPVSSFEPIKDTSQINKDFKKTVTKKVMTDIFLKLMFKILKNYTNFKMIYHFYMKK